MPAARYHRPTAVDWPAALRALIISSGIAAIAGILYAFALHFIMIDKLRMFCTIAAGAAVGVCVGMLVKKSRIGSVRLTVLIAFLSACFGLYIHWIFWIAELSGWQAWLFDPMQLAHTIYRINAIGTWSNSSSGAATAGIELAVFWTLETLTILGCAVFFPLAMLKDSLFCPTCLAWITPTTESILIKPLGERAHLRRELEAENYQPLDAMVLTDDPHTGCSQFSLHSCGRCDQFHVLDLIDIKESKPGTTADKIKQTVVVGSLLISAATYEKILAKIAELTASARAAESSEQAAEQTTQAPTSETAEPDDTSI